MRRALQLIPFSRFHKRVLFIGESCKTAGARFTGYPVELSGRIELVRNFEPLLLKHFDNLERVLAISTALESAQYRVADQNKKLSSLLRLSFENSATEENLNNLGEELVAHIRYVERTVFPRIQDMASAQELEQIRQIAINAGFYEMH